MDNPWLDYGGLATGLAALAGFVGLFVTRKSRTEESQTSFVRTAVVDAPVLAQFRELFERIGALEVDLAEARIELKQALAAIDDMKKIEEFLEAKIHERDKQILGLNEQLTEARKRIKHLEDVCKRAGINGDDPC